MSNQAEIQRMQQALQAGSELGDQFKATNVSGLDAPGSYFDRAFLRYTDFSGANLAGSTFRDANLRHANFAGADLRNCRFEGADIGKANFAGANVSGATIVRAASLLHAKGITHHKLFLPQRVVESCLDEPGFEQVHSEQKLTLENREYTLVEAFRVTELVDGADEHKILGTIQTQKSLEALGAEVYPDSALIGDVGFVLTPGFLAETEPMAPQKSKSSTASVPAPSSDSSNDKTDVDLLNDFLLGTME